MGWASGGEVFDPVAKRMIEYNVPADVMTDVLAKLIEGLQGRGWDTESESLGEFQDTPAIVDAFAVCHIYRDDDRRNPDFAEFRNEHKEDVRLMKHCPYGGSCKFCYPV